jgi:hypothetical protein
MAQVGMAQRLQIKANHLAGKKIFNFNHTKTFQLLNLFLSREKNV